MTSAYEFQKALNKSGVSYEALSNGVIAAFSRSEQVWNLKKGEWFDMKSPQFKTFLHDLCRYCPEIGSVTLALGKDMPVEIAEDGRIFLVVITLLHIMAADPNFLDSVRERIAQKKALGLKPDWRC